MIRDHFRQNWFVYFRLGPERRTFDGIWTPQHFGRVIKIRHTKSALGRGVRPFTREVESPA